MVKWGLQGRGMWPGGRLELMSDYRPPLADIRLVLEEISDISSICGLPGYEQVDSETIYGVLDELARFVAEVVAPVNQIGDQEGCSVADGVVTTPEAFHTAWDKFVEAGWGAISQDPNYGGGGFPGVVQTVMTELLATASRAWSPATPPTATGTCPRPTSSSPSS